MDGTVTSQGPGTGVRQQCDLRRAPGDDAGGTRR